MDTFMKEALVEAEKAKGMDEVPVGAVIVKDGKIIARAHNLKETLKDITAHAEILALKQASEVANNWRLNGCDMYVTLEPCPMCASAIAQARIRNLYIGTFDPITGGCGSVIDVIGDTNLNYRVNVEWSYNRECGEILEEFFREKREGN
jgi:tRNA(adenine34) deaminase